MQPNLMTPKCHAFKHRRTGKAAHNMLDAAQSHDKHIIKAEKSSSSEKKKERQKVEEKLKVEEKVG